MDPPTPLDTTFIRARGGPATRTHSTNGPVIDLALPSGPIGSPSHRSSKGCNHRRRTAVYTRLVLPTPAGGGDPASCSFNSYSTGCHLLQPRGCTPAPGPWWATVEQAAASRMASSAAAAAAPVSGSSAGDLPIEGKTVKALTLLSLKRTYELFAGNHDLPVPVDEERCVRTRPRLGAGTQRGVSGGPARRWTWGLVTSWPVEALDRVVGGTRRGAGAWADVQGGRAGPEGIPPRRPRSCCERVEQVVALATKPPHHQTTT